MSATCIKCWRAREIVDGAISAIRATSRTPGGSLGRWSRPSAREITPTPTTGRRGFGPSAPLTDRKSVEEGTSVSVRVDLGGRRIIKKNKRRNKTYNQHT